MDAARRAVNDPQTSTVYDPESELDRSMGDVSDIEAEILRLTAAISALRDAKETMDAFGVPFTQKQERMLDWYEERRMDLERLLMIEDESYDDNNPAHAKVVHDETLWADERVSTLDLMLALLKRKDDDKLN